MADLRLDLVAFEEAESRLRSLCADLRETSALDRRGAESAGHPLLASTLSQFTEWWHLRRGGLVEELGFLADAAEAVHGTFRELDDDLARRLLLIAPES